MLFHCNLLNSYLPTIFYSDETHSKILDCNIIAVITMIKIL